jgi:hypothetical protein
MMSINFLNFYFFKSGVIPEAPVVNPETGFILSLKAFLYVLTCILCYLSFINICWLFFSLPRQVIFLFGKLLR